MNEEFIQKKLKSKILTYNDLNDEQFESLREILTRCTFFATDSKNMWLLLKYLAQSKNTNWDMKSINGDIKYEETRFKFSEEPVLIPVSLNKIMEYLISRDLEVEGVFKRSPLHSKIKEALKEFGACLQKNEDLDEKIGKYSTLEIASVFKEVLGSYKHSIIPSEFVNYLCSIQRSKIPDMEKIRAIRILIFQLPKRNLDILQSVIFYIRIIHDIVSKYRTKTMKQISLDGFIAVITPRLIASTRITDLSDMVDLTDIVMFMAQHFGKIISILEIH